MAKFDFVLVGSPCVHRLEVAADDLDQIATEVTSTRFVSGDLDQIATEVTSTRFVSGDLDPDEWGQVRRVAIRSDRIQVIAEAE